MPGATVEAQPHNPVEKPSVTPIGVVGRTVTMAEMCQMLSIARRSFQDMVLAGCPVVDHGGRGKAMQVDVASVLAWVRDRDRKGEDPTKIAGATAALDARRRNAEAQAELREFELKKLRGETILVSEVMPIVREELAGVRARLLQIASRLAPQITPEMTILEIEEAIDEEIREALIELTVDQVELKRVA